MSRLPAAAWPPRLPCVRPHRERLFSLMARPYLLDLPGEGWMPGEVGLPATPGPPALCGAYMTYRTATGLQAAPLLTRRGEPELLDLFICQLPPTDLTAAGSDGRHEVRYCRALRHEPEGRGADREQPPDLIGEDAKRPGRLRRSDGSSPAENRADQWSNQHRARPSCVALAAIVRAGCSRGVHAAVVALQDGDLAHPRVESGNTQVIELSLRRERSVECDSC